MPPPSEATTVLSDATRTRVRALLEGALHRQPSEEEIDAYTKRLVTIAVAVTSMAKLKYDEKPQST